MYIFCLPLTINIRNTYLSRISTSTVSQPIESFKRVFMNIRDSFLHFSYLLRNITLYEIRIIWNLLSVFILRLFRVEIYHPEEEFPDACFRKKVTPCPHGGNVAFSHRRRHNDGLQFPQPLHRRLALLDWPSLIVFFKWHLA